MSVKNSGVRLERDQGSDLIGMEVKMATMTAPRLVSRLSGLWRHSEKPLQSRKVYEFADRVYRDTKGPTPELRKLYAEFVENKRKAAKLVD